MGKPAVFPTGPVDLSQVTWNGVSANRYPVWNGTRFVPTALPSSGSSGATFTEVAVPGAAYRKRPSGQPNAALQSVWDRYEANVRLFGAAGNGGTNDTQATNQAIDAVNVNGGSIYFPAGTYALDASALNYLTANIQIRGDGIGVTIIDFQGSGGFSVSNASGGFTIKGVSIHNSTTAIDADCAEFYACESAFEGSHRGLDITGVAKGFASDCLFASLGTATGIYGDFSGMEFSDLRFLDDGDWQDGVNLGTGLENIFGNIYVGNAVRAAIALGTATYGNRVSNVSFKNIAGAQPILNLGTNNYVSDQYGLGGNANTDYDARKNLISVFNWNAPPIPIGTGYYDDFNVPGTSFGDQAIWGAPVLFDPAVRVQSQVVASDTVRLSVINLGTATVDIDSGAWRIRVLN
jgi:hypothetical protein